MRLKDFCTTDVVYCSRETPLLEAARLMRQRHVGDLVVVNDLEDDFTPLGLVTDRDIVVEALGNAGDISRMTAGSIMHAPLVWADESEDSSTAITRMREHGVRRLPVMGHDGCLVGIVTLDDLLRQLRLEVDALIDIVTREQEQERSATR